MLQRAGLNLIATVPSTSARARAVPSIQPLLAGYPTGTPTSNPDLDLAQRSASSSLDEYFGSFRIDHHINDKLHQYLRYNRDQGYLTQPLDVTGSSQIVTAVPQNAVYTLTQILSATMVNETKLGLNANKTRISGVTPLIPGVDTSAFAVSFTGTVAIPGVGGQGSSAGAASLGNLVRGNSSQNGRGQPYTGYTGSLIDSLSIIRREHNLKFGGEYRQIRLYTDRLGGTTYTFPNINALLANQPTNIQVLGDTSAPDPWNNGATGNRFLKRYYLVGYAQDEWKVRPNLTINYGLRWEYYQPIHEDRNLSVLFNAETGKLACGTQPGATCRRPPLVSLQEDQLRAANRHFLVARALQEQDRVPRGRRLLLRPGPDRGPGAADRLRPSQPHPDLGRRVPGQSGHRARRVQHQRPEPRLPAARLRRGYKLPEKILSYTASIQHSSRATRC